MTNFLNGGGPCYIVRIGGDRSADGKGSAAKKKVLTEGQPAMLSSYRVIAFDSGTGNTPNITVQVTDSAAENRRAASRWRSSAPTSSGSRKPPRAPQWQRRRRPT